MQYWYFQYCEYYNTGNTSIVNITILVIPVSRPAASYYPMFITFWYINHKKIKGNAFMWQLRLFQKRIMCTRLDINLFPFRLSWVITYYKTFLYRFGREFMFRYTSLRQSRKSCKWCSVCLLYNSVVVRCSITIITIINILCIFKNLNVNILIEGHNLLIIINCIYTCTLCMYI